MAKSPQDIDHQYDLRQHRPFQRSDLIKKIPVSHLITFNNFYKTRLCSRLASGSCEWGETCNFAHSEYELRGLNDLSSTRMCPQLLQNGCCNKQGCRFAHDEKELKATDSLYKTSICIEFKKLGRCRLGPRCRHAHGESELRPKPVALFNIHDPRKFVREQQRKLRLRHQNIGRRSELGKDETRDQDFGAERHFAGNAATPFDAMPVPREMTFAAPTLLGAPSSSSLHKSKKDTTRTTSSTAGETPCDELSSPDEPSESAHQQQFQLFQLKRQLQQLQQQLQQQQQHQQRQGRILPQQPLLSRQLVQQGSSTPAFPSAFYPLAHAQGVSEAAVRRDFSGPPLARPSTPGDNAQAEAWREAAPDAREQPSDEEEVLLALLSLLTAGSSRSQQLAASLQECVGLASSAVELSGDSLPPGTPERLHSEEVYSAGVVEAPVEPLLPLTEADVPPSADNSDVLLHYLQGVELQPVQEPSADTAEHESPQDSASRFRLERQQHQQQKWRDQQRDWLTQCLLQARQAELSELLQSLQR